MLVLQVLLDLLAALVQPADLVQIPEGTALSSCGLLRKCLWRRASLGSIA